jgi:hypothetical protein
MSRKYPTLPLQTIKDYPKSFDKLKEWIKVAGISQNDLDIEKIAESIIVHTPRFLYDFFDDHKIHISITAVISTVGTSFVWSTDQESSFHSETRIEAEEEAFTEAFKELNA